MAICRIYGQKVKRGQGAKVGITALRQPMQRHHKLAWENHGSDLVVQPATATTASPSGMHPVSCFTTSAEGNCLSFPSSAGPDAHAPPPSPHQLFRQQSITEAIAKRQYYACTHPTEQKLNVLLAKLLVLHSHPIQVVDPSPFRELMT